jgi:hypothetical protein
MRLPPLVAPLLGSLFLFTAAACTPATVSTSRAESPTEGPRKELKSTSATLNPTITETLTPTVIPLCPNPFLPHPKTADNNTFFFPYPNSMLFRCMHLFGPIFPGATD